MRTQFKNSISALVYQFVAIVVGLIIPRLMIQAFGSSTYGLGSSITQFLSYVTLIEGGIGGVARAALYKAFASKDNDRISSILKVTDRFFKKVAAIFVAYIIILSFVYPRYINSTFDAMFTGSLIVIIAISSLAQYCFGITYSIFLQADQKNYVSYSIQILTVVLNAIATVILINVGASFHMVKLVSTIVFVLRPIFFNLYVKRNYNINKKVNADDSALSQKWNGMAHHIAWFLHTNTDVVIITLFGALSDVAIYSVYYMVASSMTKIASAMVSGAEALFGNMMASEGTEKAKEKFSFYSMFMNTVVIVLFATAASMLMPFISLYTKGITDANYYIPLLGFFLLAAEGLYCLRVPYHGIVTAAGKFKETQTSAILEATINIVLSVGLIKIWGLPGVAVATLIAMLYRTIYYIWYLSYHVLKIQMIQNMIRVFFAVIAVIMVVTLKIVVVGQKTGGYVNWIFQAIVCAVIAVLVAFLYDLLFYKNELLRLIKFAKKKFSK